LFSWEIEQSCQPCIIQTEARNHFKHVETALEEAANHYLAKANHLLLQRSESKTLAPIQPAYDLSAEGRGGWKAGGDVAHGN
jgi:hypothetical protein